MEIELSLFPSVYSPAHTSKKIEWAEWSNILTSPIQAAKKDGVPMFSPAIFEHAQTKEGEAVRHVTAIVVDVDHGTQEELSETLRGLGARGITFLVYSTFQHTPAEPRYRVVIPLAAPVTRADYPAVFSRVLRLFPYLDQQCSDPNRCYYLHSCPPGGSPFARVREGRPMTLADLPTASETPGEAVVPPSPVTMTPTREMIAALGTRFLRAKSGSTMVIGQKLIELSREHAYAEEGEGDSWTYRLTSAIVKEWPDCDEQATAALFLGSISHGVESGSCHDPFPLDKIVEKIRRHKDAAQSAKNAREAVQVGEHQRYCQMAWAGTEHDGRTSPYTEEEIEQICDRHGCRKKGQSAAEALQKYWIVQHGKTFYIFSPRGYRECIRDTLVPACLEALSPAITAGVELYRMTEKGQVPLTPPELMAKYGRVAERSILSVLPEQTRFCEETREVVQAVAQMRLDLTPQHDPLIERWLRALAGDHYPNLLRWLYFFTSLEKPCAALFLHGPGGTGKSLLLSGLAAFWGRGRGTDLSAIADNFTQGIGDCPFLVAEEELPDNGRRGGVNMAWFRDLVQAREHTLKVKYSLDRMIRGCVRIMIVGQKESILHTSDLMTAADAEAISERIASIPVQEEAREILSHIPQETLVEWVERGIARHVLAIPSQESQGRFLVKINSVSEQRGMVTRSHLGSSVVQWVAMQLINATCADDLRAMGIRVRGSEILVQASNIVTTWGAVFQSEPRPRVRAVASVLDAMSTGRERCGDKIAHVLDPAPMITWAEDTGEHYDLFSHLSQISS
jgi:hypothetical protein